MSFSVDGWDPTYGTSLELEDDLGDTSAEVDVGVERAGGGWRPIGAGPSGGAAGPVLFVDGVRRIEARVWIDDVSNGSPRRRRHPRRSAPPTRPGWCAAASRRRAPAGRGAPAAGLFTVAAACRETSRTSAGTFAACHAAADRESAAVA